MQLKEKLKEEKLLRRLYNKKKIRHFDTLFMDEKDAYDITKGDLLRKIIQSGLRKAKEEKKKEI